MSEQTTLGRHMVIDLYDCDRAILDDAIYLEKAMLEAANIAGVTIINHQFHKFAPQGVSGSIVIAESHFNIHTWPEHNYAAIDLFTCGTGYKYDEAAIYLIEQLKAKRHNIKQLARGVLPVIDNQV